MPGEAHLAPAADREEAGGHVIARREAEHARTDRLDDAGPLVAPHQREQPRIGPHLRVGGSADVVGPEVLVGMAQTRGRPPDQHLVVRGRIQVDLQDLPVLLPIPEHCRLHLHRLELLTEGGGGPSQGGRQLELAVDVPGRSVPQNGVGEFATNPVVSAFMIQAHVWGGLCPKLVA